MASAALFDDGLPASARGRLGGLDARAKVLGLLTVLVSATFMREPYTLALCIAVIWLAAALLGAPLRRMGLLLLSVPAFTGLLALPAILSLVTPGEPVVRLVRLGGGHLGPWQVPEFLDVTAPGILVAGRFILRSMACVSAGALLATVTPPQELLRGFRGLGVPVVFTMVAAMAVRYLDTLLRCVEELHLAKISRTLARLGPGRERAWVAAGMGELFRRSRLMAGEVTDAMVSRGFTGEPRLLRPASIGPTEGLFVVACIAFAVTLLALERG